MFLANIYSHIYIVNFVRIEESFLRKEYQISALFFIFLHVNI